MQRLETTKEQKNNKFNKSKDWLFEKINKIYKSRFSYIDLKKIKLKLLKSEVEVGMLLLKLNNKFIKTMP